MAKVRFLKGFSDITIKRPDKLMQILLMHSVPVASSCGGEGICGKCQVKISKGQDNLSAKRKLEIDCLARNGIFDKTVRLSCQCHVIGDVEVDTDYW